MQTRDWRELAKCTLADADALFAPGRKQQWAKRICAACPVMTECREWALTEQIPWGMWGGMTERERTKKLGKRRNMAGYVGDN